MYILLNNLREFAADGRTESEISKLIGADKLFYQDLDDLISAVKDPNSPVKGFDSSCFDGNYVTPHAPARTPGGL